jgi:hypothetical protein
MIIQILFSTKKNLTTLIVKYTLFVTNFPKGTCLLKLKFQNFSALPFPMRRSLSPFTLTRTAKTFLPTRPCSTILKCASHSLSSTSPWRRIAKTPKLYSICITTKTVGMAAANLSLIINAQPNGFQVLL